MPQVHNPIIAVVLLPPSHLLNSHTCPCWEISHPFALRGHSYYSHIWSYIVDSHHVGVAVHDEIRDATANHRSLRKTYD